MRINKLFKKLKLTEYLTTELEIQKNEFVNKLRENVDEGDTGFFSDSFDMFSSSKNEYKGNVGFEGFKIKRRRRFFDMNMNFAIAKGKFIQRDNLLIIETEIKGFHGMMIPTLIILIFIYSFFIGAFLMSDNIEGNEDGFAIPFLIFHAVFMLGIPYLVMRRSINRMKHDLERELYYMTKKSQLNIV